MESPDGQDPTTQPPSSEDEGRQPPKPVDLEQEDLGVSMVAPRRPTQSGSASRRKRRRPGKRRGDI